MLHRVRMGGHRGFDVQNRLLRSGAMDEGRVVAAWLLLLFLVAVAPASAQASAPLADAAEHMDHAKVAALLKQRVDVNTAQADGMTALHWAAYHDDARLVSLLIEAGASAKAANR